MACYNGNEFDFVNTDDNSQLEIVKAKPTGERDVKAEDVAREAGVSKPTIYAWNAKIRWDGCELGARARQ